MLLRPQQSITGADESRIIPILRKIHEICGLDVIVAHLYNKGRSTMPNIQAIHELLASAPRWSNAPPEELLFEFIRCRNGGMTTTYKQLGKAIKDIAPEQYEQLVS